MRKFVFSLALIFSILFLPTTGTAHASPTTVVLTDEQLLEMAEKHNWYGRQLQSSDEPLSINELSEQLFKQMKQKKGTFDIPMSRTLDRDGETQKDIQLKINEAVYQANAEALIAELEVLNQEFEEQLAQLEDRRIVVQHAAFGYLTHAYDLEQVAIAGISSTQEPSAQALASMQDFIKSEQISVVYVEPSLDQAIANTVTSVSDVELRPLRTLETVSADEMAEGIDYFSIMRDNLVELTR